MLLALLVACVRLEEGDYELDYEPVKVDTCNLYDGGQVAIDTTGEVSWDDTTLVFEFDETDEELEFQVDGKDFSRESHGLVALSDECALATVQDDVGVIVSSTRFEGETELVADFEGNCTFYEVIFDTPCLVEFEWAGEIEALNVREI